MTLNQSNRSSKITIISPNATLDLIFSDLSNCFSDKYFFQNFTERPGGSGINVARALSDLGLNSIVTVFSILGGNSGQRVKTLLKNENISSEIIPGDSDTRVTAIQYGKNKKKMAVSPSPVFQKNEIKSLLACCESRTNDSDLVFFGGSFNADKTAKDYLVSFLSVYQEKLILDTRGDILDSILNKGPVLSAKIDLSDLSHNQLDIRYGAPTQINSHCDDIRSWGIRLAVFETREQVHAIINGEKDLLSQPQFNDPAARPYGRGDAFMAGIIKSLINKNGTETKDLQNAFETGCLAGRCSGSRTNGLGSINAQKFQNAAMAQA